jgi:hypothetical protein
MIIGKQTRKHLKGLFVDFFSVLITTLSEKEEVIPFDSYRTTHFIVVSLKKAVENFQLPLFF